MSPSDAFVTFYTLLLGLGVAALLSRFAEVIRRRRLRDVGVLGMLLTLLIVFEFLSGWAGSSRTFHEVEVNIASLALPFATGACYFMAAVLILPEPAEIERTDLGAYVGAQVRVIGFFLFAANLSLVGAELPFVVEQFQLNPDYLWFFYLPYNAAILACYGVVTAGRSRKAAVAAMITLILIYVWVTITKSI